MSYTFKQVPFSDLVGQTIIKIKGATKGSEKIRFTTETKSYYMIHNRDCCESVDIEDIYGDVEDLIGTPVVIAEEVSNTEDPPPDERYVENTYTWTFYNIYTNKGSVTFRWFGSSNGYYSEKVDFEEIIEEK